MSSPLQQKVDRPARAGHLGASVAGRQARERRGEIGRDLHDPILGEAGEQIDAIDLDPQDVDDRKVAGAATDDSTQLCQ